MFKIKYFDLVSHLILLVTLTLLFSNQMEETNAFFALTFFANEIAAFCLVFFRNAIATKHIQSNGE